MQELEDFIMNELPNDGSWWHDGFDAFIELAVLLRNKGVGDEIIKAHLQAVYTAVAEEFGE